jgi:hypothetical protein
MPRIVFALFCLLFLAPFSAIAALVPTTQVSVAVSATPAYQSPGSLVSLSATAQVPQGVYTYIWKVNGHESARGVDMTSFIAASGANGEVTDVTVTLQDSDGSVIGVGEYVLRPAEVALVWEGNTYVPPFYLGRALPNGESTIVVQAIPQFVDGKSTIPASELSYGWSVDGKALPSISGKGRSSMRVQATQYKYATTVSVVVSASDRSYAASAATTINHQTPFLAVYLDKPLSGVLMNEMVGASVPFSGDEMSFKAVPFFTSNPSALTFSWTLSAQPFTLAGNDPSVATFRKTGDGTGTFPVGVSIAKEGSILEKGTQGFTLSFE